MLMHPRHSMLLIIDVQERLVPAIHEPSRLVDHCVWLAQLANELGIPVKVSEQYPQGLGATVAALREQVDSDALMEKVYFSCTGEESCRAGIFETGRDQIVVSGIEVHVCVLQSVLNFLEMGKQVFVVADAVSSRKPEDARLGIERMRQAGAQIVTREMVFFEWMQKAGTDRFKALSKTYVR